jgi:chorismate dehydratase
LPAPSVPMHKLKVSIVSYLNSRPFLEGIRNSGFEKEIDLSLDIPAACAAKLLDGRVDIGLVPVAVLPQMEDYHIITDYCIGSDGPVRSVGLYSQVPLEQIQTIILDNQSRTSVALVKILCEKLWNIHPIYTLGIDGYEGQIGGTTAGVVIGDRTFGLKHPYFYDLSEAWKNLTGLPFVFACWASRSPVDAQMEERFNMALKQGIGAIDPIAETFKPLFPPGSDLSGYLRHNISYSLDERKRQGLRTFLSMLPGK